MTQPLAPLIATRHVSAAYDGRPALSDVSVVLRPGRSLSLIGPNGSGKTTLLRVLAGLLDSSSGEVERRAERIAYVAQHVENHHWMPLTAREVVRMGRYGRVGLVGRLRPSDRSAIDHALERLDVADLADRQFGELSGGQRQRVLVAQALAQEAPVLLLDEPVTGLDLPSQERILDLLDEQTEAGTAVVLSTHSLDEARRCDEVVLLVGGRVEAQGRPSEVLTVEHLEATFGGRLVQDRTTGQVVVDDHAHGDHRHGLG